MCVRMLEKVDKNIMHDFSSFLSKSQMKINILNK